MDLKLLLESILIVLGVLAIGFLAIGPRRWNLYVLFHYVGGWEMNVDYCPYYSAQLQVVVWAQHRKKSYIDDQVLLFGVLYLVQ